MFTGCQNTDSPKVTNEPEATKYDPGEVLPTNPPVSEIELSGEWGKSITNAYNVKNQVIAYYNDTDRSSYHFGNTIFEADFCLQTKDENLVSNVKNKKGSVYLDKALESYYEDTDGNVYYSKNSSTGGRVNIMRYGYYYYDLRILDLNFGAGYSVSSELPINAGQIKFIDHHVKNVQYSDNKVSYVIDGNDPYMAYGIKTICNASDYNAIEFTLKAPKGSHGEIFYASGSYNDFNGNQHISFSVKSSEEELTYLVSFDGATDYTGALKGIRFDIDGETGSIVEISNIRLVKVEYAGADLVLDQQFHLYGDKINTAERIVAKSASDNLKALGVNSYVDVKKVSKIVVKDGTGIHDSLDNVDWNTAEYVGFDINDAGIFGYILVADDDSGKLTVTIENGFYKINQEASIKNQRLKKLKDAIIGQRLYFDETHSFDNFLKEAEIERHPIEMKIKGYVGYDAIRGAYTYKVSSTGFNDPYFTCWNKHYDVSATIKNQGDSERKIYVLTTSTSGCLEDAVVLDQNNLLLPITLEVSKNFKGENEEPIYDSDDTAYGEAIFPVVLEKDQEISMTILNLYQNWGNFPLKQISSIQYYAPYYHLSTGVTETSCIAPWYSPAKDLWTLPDFRPMSAPFWYEMIGEYYNNQPQHTHGGFQYFLQYTDSNGNVNGTENIDNNVISNGPSYAQVEMTYLSDDGKVKATYIHTEMPQTDENRVYYEMTFEVLGDISLSDFKKDLSFYSAYAYAGKYQTIGYLDENNQFVTSKTNASGTPKYVVLGDDCPYFALYNYQEDSHNGFIDNGNNTNLGCSIYNYDIIVGGKKYDGKLCLALENSGAKLTLNIGKTTLKKGDKITINMIIGPWGYQESTDDSNVRNIRENSCKNILTATPINGEKIESVFLPSVKSVDGKTCEFTLTGGANNGVVRVYGFTELAAPKIYELIDGEYVLLDISSENNPDKAKNHHTYDGYTVFYDGDGTFSYAFVSERTGNRTFKVVVEN